MNQPSDYPPPRELKPDDIRMLAQRNGFKDAAAKMMANWNLMESGKPMRVGWPLPPSDFESYRKAIAECDNGTREIYRGPPPFDLGFFQFLPPPKLPPLFSRARRPR